LNIVFIPFQTGFQVLAVRCWLLVFGGAPMTMNRFSPKRVEPALNVVFMWGSFCERSTYPCSASPPLGLILSAEAQSRLVAMLRHRSSVSHERVVASLTAVGWRQRLRGGGLAARAAVAALSRCLSIAPSFRTQDFTRVKNGSAATKARLRLGAYAPRPRRRLPAGRLP
jgi:hypothetical protein